MHMVNPFDFKLQGIQMPLKAQSMDQVKMYEARATVQIGQHPEGFCVTGAHTQDRQDLHGSVMFTKGPECCFLIHFFFLAAGTQIQ